MSGEAVRDSTPGGSPNKSEGGFVPGAELHRSALAVLYLAGREAEQPNSPRYVVRRLLPEHADDPELRALLLREKFVASQVRSRHLTQVVSAFDGPVPFTVMEYVQGFSLEELLRRAGGQTHWVRFLVPAVVDALTALAALHAVRDAQTGAPALSHQAPVPRHILLGLDGIARLTDLTQCVGPGLPWTAACSRRLRVWEMAPEQVLAPAHIDHRCDIFVAAATLWRVLTGEALFQGSSPQDTLQKVMRAPVPSLQEAGIPMDGGMERVLRQALARSRHQRLDSAAEFAETLRRHAQQAGFWAERNEVAEFVTGQWTARMLVAPSAPRAPVAPAPRPRAAEAPPDSGISPLPGAEPEAPGSGAHVILNRFVPSRPSSLPPLIVRPAPSRAPSATVPGRGATGAHGEVVTAASRFGADRGAAAGGHSDPLLGHTIDPYAARTVTKPLTSTDFSARAGSFELPAAESWGRAHVGAAPVYERAQPQAAAEPWPPSPAFTAAAPSEAPGPMRDPTWPPPTPSDQSAGERRRWTLKKVSVVALSGLLFGGFAALVIADLAAPVRVLSTPGQSESGLPQAEPSLPGLEAVGQGASLPTSAAPEQGAADPVRLDDTEPAPTSPPPAGAGEPSASEKPSAEKPAAEKSLERAEAHESAHAQSEAAAPARSRRSSAEKRKAAQVDESADESPSVAPASTQSWSSPPRTSDQPEWLRRNADGVAPSKAAGPQLPDNPY